MRVLDEVESAGVGERGGHESCRYHAHAPVEDRLVPGRGRGARPEGRVVALEARPGRPLRAEARAEVLVDHREVEVARLVHAREDGVQEVAARQDRGLRARERIGVLGGRGMAAGSGLGGGGVRRDGRTSRPLCP